MMKHILTFGFTVAFGGLLALGCGRAEHGDQPFTAVILSGTANNAAADETGWGTIKGQIVFDSDKVPERKPLDVNKDLDHCLKNGPVNDEAWVVNPKNKGVRWVVVWLKHDPKKPLPVHDRYKMPLQDAVLDQPRCAFEPHVLAIRTGQSLVVRNSAPVIHTVTINGFENQVNETLQPNGEKKYTLRPERMGVKMSCGIHPWMVGWVWIFEHPYYAITDADGNFEIKLAPTGPQRLVIWQESIGYLGGRAGRDGREIQVKSEGVTDVGAIKIKPTE